MNSKYGKFVVLGLLLTIAGVGCSNAAGGSGANRDLITQDEIEQNKKAAAMKHPGGEPEQK